MSFIEEIKKKAKENIKTIVLPESNDIRVLKAVDIVYKEGYSDIILIGNKEEILKIASQNNIDVSKAKNFFIIFPLSSITYNLPYPKNKYN